MARSRRLVKAVIPRRWLALGGLVVVLALLVVPSALEATTDGAAITNGTVALGVNAIGDLNYNCDPALDNNCPDNPSQEAFGVRFLPTGSDATSPGCPCEGWGVGDATSGLAGFANESEGGGHNLTLDSFVANATSAVSTVTVSDPAIAGYQLQVVQDYHPSAATPNLYEATVTINNTGANAITNLQYRRVMDWDVEPSAFDEWVTIQNPGNSPQLLFDSDEGFASANPLDGPSYLDSETVCGTGYTGPCTFTDLGLGGTYPTVTTPDDHGSLFDFQFGALAAGASKSFKIFYGGAASETGILSALQAVGAEVYSIGEDNCPETGFDPGADPICTGVAAHGGVEHGLPNAFGFGFVTTSADLSITKGDSPDPVTVGTNLTYTLHVQNAGPNSAAAVHVNDPLPANVTFVSATPSVGSCTGTTTVDCDLGTLANGASATITIVVTPTVVGPLSNTATVSATSADSNPADNSSTAATTVQAVPSADLSITKTDSPDPVTVGTNLTYTLTAANAGPSPAAAVSVSDTLPAGVTFVSATPSVGSCSGTATVTCNLGTLASGASATVTIVVTPTATGPLSNTATVSSTTADPSSTNNSSTATTTVNPAATSADLSITKSDSPDPVTAGTNLTYTLTVANGGPDSAAGVSVSDTLPAGVTFVSATPSVGSCSGTATVTCSLGTLANGASATIAIVVTPTAAGPLSNTATVSSTTSDPSSANNSATATTTVNPASTSADLSITKTDSPDPVTVGTNLTYTIIASNGGPDSAAAVTVTDTLPAGVTFVSATPSVGSCSGTATVTCTIGTLASGASATVTIVVTPTATGPLSNTATVSSTTSDPSSANNSATASTMVNAAPTSADVSITKTDSPDPVTAGSNLTYTIVASNAGPDPATAVSVSDTLPAGVTFVSSSSSVGSCSGTATVTCALGTLAPGASATVTIVVTPAAAGPLSNTATVGSGTSDPNTANNSATATTTVNAAPTSADLSITKTDSPDPVTVGTSLTYTLTVANAGPDAAMAVSAGDTLPAGVTFVSASATGGGSCTGTTTVSCTWTAIAPGGSATVTIVVTPTAAGPLSNTATVTSSTSDPSSANNSATATTTVNPAPTPHADLSLAKSASSGPFMVGGQIAYTLTVANAGPDTAMAATATDALPAGLVFVSASATGGGSCTGTTTVVCSWTSLASGASVTATITVTATAAGHIVNTATAASQTDDPSPANNSGSAAVDVAPVNQPPVCGGVTADPSALWPPNHKFVLVTLTGGTDPDGDPVTVVVTGVTQDEPAGDNGPDWMAGTALNTVWLRSERDGSDKDGRTYTVAFTVTDSHGASCSGTIPVRVAHDMGH